MPNTARPFYVTTPIYYVNDSPHIGHAYTTIAADVTARYQRLRGVDVKFLTGTDEHGQKVDKAALNAGVAPQAFTDEVSQRFRTLVHDPLREDGGANLLGISNDDFIRTTEERHKLAATELWKRMEANGYVYLDSYAGWYAVRDEAYYQESELIEKNGKKVAPTGAEVEWVTEESYFFKLSAFGDKLLEFYEKNPDFVYPQSRYNEVKSFVKGGLKDLSISRTTFNWGVPVPNNPAHVMYVWVDALTNYMTSAGFPATDGDFAKFWGTEPSQPGNCVHLVGKDILRFHAVYWPAFLMAANLPLPRQIVAHGWWTIEGEKMSKSLGNVLSPADMIALAGGVDQLRYFMMKAMPFGNDGDFSKSRMVDLVNADLANKIGNLAQRTLSMIQKNCDGKVPAFEPDNLTEEDYAYIENFLVTQKGTPEAVDAKFRNFDFVGIMNDIVNIAEAANEYIDKQKPWSLKDNPARRDAVLYILAEGIRCLAVYLQPFIPTSSAKILDLLGVEDSPEARNFSSTYHYEFSKTSSLNTYALKSGTVLPAPSPVFPRLEQAEAAA
jgi:methionyl-tRNA synthetase